VRLSCRARHDHPIATTGFLVRVQGQGLFFLLSCGYTESFLDLFAVDEGFPVMVVIIQSRGILLRIFVVRKDKEQIFLFL